MQEQLKSLLSNYGYSVEERFMRYAAIDTQSDPTSGSQPSTAKQKDLGWLLEAELKELGVHDAILDEHGYVYASLPSNTDKRVPAICLCAHMDVSPDCNASEVKPIVHRSYSGGDITLPDDPSQVIRVAEHPYLATKKGDDIITASGLTLLGADDKAGVAVIMDLVRFLLLHPHVEHGRISILFTPDEEIGRGVDRVDLGRVAADFAYTLDGGELGSIEDETFSADGVTVMIGGVSTHPGDARDKMVNAIKVASALLEMLPKDAYSPETTSGREGFIHPVRISGSVESATVEFIIRDFYTRKLAEYEEFLRDRIDALLAKFPGATATMQVTEQYRNMKEVLDKVPHVAAYAKEAMLRAGITPVEKSARGGTDGSRLSYMGLPCPNLFTGEMAFHGKHEFVSVQDMQKSVMTLAHLISVWVESS